MRVLFSRVDTLVGAVRGLTEDRDVAYRLGRGARGDRERFGLDRCLGDRGRLMKEEHAHRDDLGARQSARRPR